jgi:hypothetical protein
MEIVYQWEAVDIQSLRDGTQVACEAVDCAWVKTQELVSVVEGDTQWAGVHRDRFIELVDLLRQYCERVADESVGTAAVGALDSFLSDWAGYYEGSELYSSLERVV